MTNDLNLFFIRHNRFTPAKQLLPSEILFHDLTILLKGKLEYIIDGKQVALSAGDMIFIKKGSVRARKLSAPNVDYISFNFTATATPELPLTLSKCVLGEIKLLIAACDEIVEKQSSPEELCQPVFSCILSLLKRRLTAKKFTPLTLKIIKFLKENLEEKITLADVGKITFFSPVYCDTIFKKETGKSVIDYLLDERISEAKKLLIEGALPLKQISEAVGITDYNYFSRLFKKRTGYTPTEYRKNFWIP